MEDARKSGGLTISKTVTGNMGSKDREFEFTVEIKDGNTPLNNVSYNYTGTKSGTLTFTDGKATFTLKHNDEITIQGLPSGVTYTVTEKDYSKDGYSTTSTNASGTITEADGENEVSFVNTAEAGLPTGYKNHTSAFMILCGGMLMVLIGLLVKNRKMAE